MSEKITAYSNKYHEIKLISDSKKNIQNKKRSHHKKWFNLNLEKFDEFIGCILHMGILKLPVLEQHWSKNPLLKTSQIGNVMSSDKFEGISRYLKIADPEKDMEYEKLKRNKDPLFKIKEFAEDLLQNCQKNYYPGQKLSLDETMIKFNGRSKLKQYMSNKPIKNGFKIFSLCDASNSYCINFRFYKRKQEKVKKI